MKSFFSMFVTLAVLLVCMMFSADATTTLAPTTSPSPAPTYSGFCGLRQDQDYIALQNNTQSIVTTNPECGSTTVTTTRTEVTIHTVIIYDN